MEQTSLPARKTKGCSAIVPVLGWIAVGFLGLNFLNACLYIRSFSNFLSNFLFPPVVLCSIFMAISFSQYRRHGKSSLLPLALLCSALSWFGDIACCLLFNSYMNAIFWLITLHAVVIFTLAFIFVCRKSSSKLLLIFAAVISLLSDIVSLFSLSLFFPASKACLT